MSSMILGENSDWLPEEHRPLLVIHETEHQLGVSQLVPTMILISFIYGLRKFTRHFGFHGLELGCATKQRGI